MSCEKEMQELAKIYHIDIQWGICVINLPRDQSFYPLASFDLFSQEKVHFDRQMMETPQQVSSANPLWESIIQNKKMLRKIKMSSDH